MVEELRPPPLPYVPLELFPPRPPAPRRPMPPIVPGICPLLPQFSFELPPFDAGVSRPRGLTPPLEKVTFVLFVQGES